MKTYILQCDGSISLPLLTCEFEAPSDEMAIETAYRWVKIISSHNIYRFWLWAENELIQKFETEMSVTVTWQGKPK